MKLVLCVTVVAFLTILAAAAKAPEPEPKNMEEWALTLDRESVHKAVLIHERDPLGDEAKDIRPILMVHFEPIHYDVCLDQIGFLLETKNKAHEAVFWQVVFGSGDYFEGNPDQQADRFAYMLAGLQSGLRAYENILLKKPKVRLQALDDLVALRDQGRLLEYVKAKPCKKS